MELTVVGAGPAYSDDPGSVGACYLLRNDDASLVLDLGQGAFARLAAQVDPGSVAAFVISHLHPDHFVDLVPLRHYLRYHRRPPVRARVIAPVGVGDRIDALHAEPGFAAAALDCEMLSPGSIEAGSFRVEAARVTHLPDSFAFRVTAAGWDGALVYSGDLGVADDLKPLLRPGDTLLVEVAFGTSAIPDGAFHLNAAAVAGLAAEMQPGRVLLTHLQMGFDRAATLGAVRAGFHGPVELVSPGFVTRL